MAPSLIFLLSHGLEGAWLMATFHGFPAIGAGTIRRLQFYKAMDAKNGESGTERDGNS